MKSVELQVEGMTCGSCVRHVNAALAPVAGVAEVEVDLAAGRVRVAGDADLQALLDVLQDAGYPARLAADGQAPAAAKAHCCGTCHS